MIRMGNEDAGGPAWLRPLLQTSFFVSCEVHADSSKSECNMYCLDCTGDALCSYCLPRHKDHRVVQVPPPPFSLAGLDSCFCLLFANLIGLY